MKLQAGEIITISNGEWSNYAQLANDNNLYFESLGNEKYRVLVNQPYTEEHKINQIRILKSYLANTDYQAMKFAEGEISAEDYESIKIQRRAWRNEINNLETELS